MSVIWKLVLVVGLGCATAAAAAIGCSPGGDEGPGDAWRPDDARLDSCCDGSDTPVVACTPDRISCAGNTARTCNSTGDGWAWQTDCVAPTGTCTDDVGCTVCRGGEGVCDGALARLCLPDGSGWIEDTCDTGAGERCSSGYCTDLSEACEAARVANSYEGCDYWAAQTTNADLPEPTTFRHAFVIGNRQATAANVEILNADGVITTTTVAPNSTATVEMNWNDALRNPRTAGPTPIFQSSIVRNGAFRIKSDVPVTVYQFNPLRYWGGSDPSMPGSYSNDASLLLPRHVLTGNYIVASRPTFMIRLSDWLSESFLGSPGFIAVVGMDDGTDVRIDVRASTQPGAGIPATTPGGSVTVRLDRFDVLQLLSATPDSCIPLREEPHPGDPSMRVGYCDMGAPYDLTGSTVSATKPVAVYAGHDCTFVPYDRWACDHLEEQMFPLEAWGTRYLATRTDPVEDEMNMWRVVSGADGNMITFNPPAHAPVALNRADWIEFASAEDFEVVGTGPLLLVQYLIGQGSNLDSIGDPAMALSVPVEQYRNAYNFLAPEDYRSGAGGQRGENWVNVIAPMSASVTLDGGPVSGFIPIGGTGFGVARVQIGGGSHAIESSATIGITCYGYGNYTSYMYPGGLDVKPINPLI